MFSAAASVFSDIYASVLPMLLVQNLNMTRRQRLGLYALFSAGLTTAGIGIARMLFLVKVTTNYQLGPTTRDITWYGWPMFVGNTLGDLKQILNSQQALTDIEAHLAIICASLPALKAIIQQARTSRVSNIYPLNNSHFEQRSPPRSTPSEIYNFSNGTAPRLRRLRVSKEPNSPRDRPLDRIPAPDSGAQRNDCRCALCASIDALEKGLKPCDMKNNESADTLVRSPLILCSS